jgi:DnaJ domain
VAANNDMDGWRRKNSDPTQIELMLMDGTRYAGTVLVLRGKHLRDVINGPEQFVEVETLHSGLVTVSKSAIKLILLGSIPAADQMEKRLAAINSSDSFEVLGLKQTATLEDVRAAFVALAHQYHPDRYATAELPTEVMAYLNIMIRRINAANGELRELLEFESKQSAATAA